MAARTWARLGWQSLRDDAMFAEASLYFLERLRSLPRRRDHRRLLLAGALAFVEFCVEDPVRYQLLLFQRTIPRLQL